MTSSETPANPTSPTSSPIPTDRQDWAELAGRVAGPDPIVETYLDKVGRLQMARLQATEMMTAETPPSTPTSHDLPTGDQDCPLPPELPDDPTHPLRTDTDQMSDEEYQAALRTWQQSEEYQTPLRQYQTWLSERRNT